MRQLPIFLLAIALLPYAAQGQNQPLAIPTTPQTTTNSDTDEESWDRLTFLTPETQVSVKTSRWTYHCQDPRATGTLFSCETRPVGGPLGIYAYSRSIQLRRSDVEEVSQRHPVRIRLIGYGTAAAAGIAFVAVRGNTASGVPQGLSDLAGSALFCLAAMPVVEAIAAFSHGTTLYRRSRAHSSPGDATLQ